VERFIASAGAPGGSLLDIGCGTGMILKLLANYGSAHGVDISEQALAYCREKVNAQLTLAAGDQLPFPDGSFSFVSLLDVIEHAGDDLSVLKEACRVLKPGGAALVTVPAFSFLWSGHDIAHGHKRRYRLPGLKRVGQEAGFTVERITYTNFFIFLPALIKRTLLAAREKNVQSDLTETPAVFNSIFLLLYSLEASILSYADFPWGVSLLMLLRKPMPQPVLNHA
jgi:SAM-dependent methyltransferase